MKYLMMIKHSERYRSEPVPQGLMDAMGVFVAESFKSGVLKDTAGLLPSSEGSGSARAAASCRSPTGRSPRRRKSSAATRSSRWSRREEAREVARDFMELHRVHWPGFDGECEVRPCEDM